ncbi:prepilin-type N-terminal cleavage/methylation domain-containing protein [Pseudidiomarina taiwanensis]|uniref:Prepilin cleavage protein n=1 Tax=Pseudidiomarina taiwanensis TaxID=337250 RepID=A0A432ZK04_9GAMM|nr:prepilin-type N-terminal cleavage/methylation domain-containing protein [Pseudidiomarina taiwanensis]RUO78347.1 prepilin cleavage protein [Pseudidiomarina taiwanensis]
MLTVQLSKQRGLSLVELMITVGLGLVLMAALTSVFSNTLGVNSRSLTFSQLQEETTAVMELMVSDIRRTGYHAGAANIIIAPDNTVTAFSDSVVISAFSDEAGSSCILFKYDINGNGVDDGNSEAFGYRLATGQIERRQSSASCTEGGWQDLTSTAMVNVSALTFTLTEQISADMTEQRVNIVLVAQAATDPTLQRTLTTDVVLRNAF